MIDKLDISSDPDQSDNAENLPLAPDQKESKTNISRKEKASSSLIN